MYILGQLHPNEVFWTKCKDNRIPIRVSVCNTTNADEESKEGSEEGSGDVGDVKLYFRSPNVGRHVTIGGLLREVHKTRNIRDPLSRVVDASGESLRLRKNQFQNTMDSMLRRKLHNVHPSVWKVAENMNKSIFQLSFTVYYDTEESVFLECIQDNPIFQTPYVTCVREEDPKIPLE